jgi:hypothetical protein
MTKSGETRGLLQRQAGVDEQKLDHALRPKSFSDYVGQKALTENLQVFARAARQRGEPLDHVLLCGPPGLGKTTLAHIIANEMGAVLHQTSGPAIEKKGDLAGLVTHLGAGDVLWLPADNAHAYGADRLRPWTIAYAHFKGGEALGEMGKTAFGLQSTAGLLDQQTQQRGMDTAYQDWLNQQQHPYDQLTFMRNMVSGFPGSTTTQTQQSSPTSNWASNAAGVASAIGGVGNLFDWWAGGGHIPERKSGLGAGRVAQLYGSLK